jgi:hypothetical protein
VFETCLCVTCSYAAGVPTRPYMESSSQAGPGESKYRKSTDILLEWPGPKGAYRNPTHILTDLPRARRGVSKPGPGRVYRNSNHILLGWPGRDGAYRNSTYILFDWPRPRRGVFEAQATSSFSGPGPEGAYRRSAHVLLDGPRPRRSVPKVKPHPPVLAPAYRSSTHILLEWPQLRRGVSKFKPHL